MRSRDKEIDEREWGGGRQRERVCVYVKEQIKEMRDMYTKHMYMLYLFSPIFSILSSKFEKSKTITNYKGFILLNRNYKFLFLEITKQFMYKHEFCMNAF